MMTSMIIANSVINAVLSCSTIALNIVTILALRKKLSEVPKNFKTLLLSMSVSDLGVGLFVQPLYITMYVMTIKLEQNNESYLPVNNTYYILNHLLCLTSFLSVTVLSADRFLAIQLHLRYQEVVTHKRILAVVISIWVFAAFFALLRLWTSATLRYIIVIILIVCLIATGLFSCKIYLVVRRLANPIQEMQVQQVAQNGAAMENNARQRKSAAAALFVYLVLLVCYLPNICIIAVIIILDPPPGRIPLPVAICADTLGLLNSSLNPLIYCWKIKHIRHAMKDVLRNLYPSHD